MRRRFTGIRSLLPLALAHLAACGGVSEDLCRQPEPCPGVSPCALGWAPADTGDVACPGAADVTCEWNQTSIEGVQEHACADAAVVSAMEAKCAAIDSCHAQESAPGHWRFECGNVECG